tara:strand:- start:229 stop:882 length:654 start_codon:yes stop_codon:yes gene_type:complete
MEMNYTNTDTLTEKLLPKNYISSVDLSNDTLNIEITEYYEEIEDLLKCWGEKCGNLGLMHGYERKYWREKSNRFSIASIIITTLSSSLSLASTSSSYYQYVMYIVGGVGLFSSLLQSLKQFYNSEEKASEHKLFSKQYSNYYRTLKLQLSLKKTDRTPASEFVKWAYKEYEKLINEAPPLKETTIQSFKEKLTNLTSYKPDICENELIIHINGRDNL